MKTATSLVEGIFIKCFLMISETKHDEVITNDNLLLKKKQWEY